jgi:small subunit ribosomal protein S10
MQAINTKPKLRVVLKGYNGHSLSHVCDELIQTVKSDSNIMVKGPVPLPTRRCIYCVLRSPHVNKDAREHFEIRTHKRLIDIYEPTTGTLKSLKGFSFPAGIDITIRTL